MTSVSVNCDLRGMLGPARDQFDRNTCAAFAASDGHAAVRGEKRDLSVEYAYFHALKRQGSSDPDDGVELGVMTETIEHDGQPYEEGWPYSPIPPKSFSDWSPPVNPGPVFRRTSETQSPTVEQVCHWLGERRPVVLGVRISDQFFQDSKDEVFDDVPNDQNAGGHAVLAVGYGQVGSQVAVLIRNSWGSEWRADGHAWLTEGYLRPRLLGAAAMVL